MLFNRDIFFLFWYDSLMRKNKQNLHEVTGKLSYSEEEMNINLEEKYHVR